MEILFPKNISCIFCNMPISRQNDLSICRKCFKKLEFIEEMCRDCGRFGKGASLCTSCAGEQYIFNEVASVLAYNDFMHSNMYGFKYGQKGFLAEYYGEMMKRYILSNQIDYDYILAVPISRKREGQRGYNQSALLARYIDEEKYIELFERKKETRFMSKLTKTQRMIELRDAFSLNSFLIDKIIEKTYQKEMDSDFLEKQIKFLIIDDILTTGSTVNEMSRLLRSQLDNVYISVLTLCNARK